MCEARKIGDASVEVKKLEKSVRVKFYAAW